MKKLAFWAFAFVALNVLLYFVFNEGRLIPQTLTGDSWYQTYNYASGYFSSFNGLYTFLAEVVDFVSKAIEKILYAVETVTNIVKGIGNAVSQFTHWLKNIF